MFTVHEQLSLVISKLAVIDIKSHVFLMRLASLQYYEHCGVRLRSSIRAEKRRQKRVTRSSWKQSPGIPLSRSSIFTFIGFKTIQKQVTFRNNIIDLDRTDSNFREGGHCFQGGPRRSGEV